MNGFRYCESKGKLSLWQQLVFVWAVVKLCLPVVHPGTKFIMGALSLQTLVGCVFAILADVTGFVRMYAVIEAALCIIFWLREFIIDLIITIPAMVIINRLKYKPNPKIINVTYNEERVELNYIEPETKKEIIKKEQCKKLILTKSMVIFPKGYVLQTKHIPQFQLNEFVGFLEKSWTIKIISWFI